MQNYKQVINVDLKPSVVISLGAAWMKSAYDYVKNTIKCKLLTVKTFPVACTPVEKLCRELGKKPSTLYGQCTPGFLNHFYVGCGYAHVPISEATNK